MQPINYLMSTGGLIWTIACVPAGVLLTWLAYFIINKVPASWLCDYDETPSAELLSGKRVRFARSGIILSVITVVSLVLCRLQFNKGYDIYFGAFALIIFFTLMIAVCDLKYTIIPDQFTIAVAVLGILISVYDLVRGFGILHTAWWSPLVGAAIGGGMMLLIDFIGMLIYKKTGMGFGDVKLFAAVGIITGFPGTIYAIAISLVTGVLMFVVLFIARKASAGKNPENKTEASEEDNASGMGEDKVSSDENTEKTAGKSENAASDGDVQKAALDDNAQKTAADENAEKSDQTSGKTDMDTTDEESGEDGSEGRGSYFAFGPAIAAALIFYIVLYDLIQFAASQYLGLFRF